MANGEVTGFAEGVSFGRGFASARRNAFVSFARFHCIERDVFFLAVKLKKSF